MDDIGFPPPFTGEGDHEVVEGGRPPRRLPRFRGAGRGTPPAGGGRKKTPHLKPHPRFRVSIAFSCSGVAGVWKFAFQSSYVIP